MYSKMVDITKGELFGRYCRSVALLLEFVSMPCSVHDVGGPYPEHSYVKNEKIPTRKNLNILKKNPLKKSGRA